MTEENQNSSSGSLDDQFISQLEVDESIRVYLAETCKWGKFLAIVGFVFIGLMVIGGIAITSVLGEVLQKTAGMPFNFRWFGLIYAVIGGIALFPTLYLFRFSTKTGAAVRTLDQMSLQEGISNLKSLFKFYGVFTAIVLGLYGLIFVFGILGAAFT